jgi:hypothetical protein
MTARCLLVLGVMAVALAGAAPAAAACPQGVTFAISGGSVRTAEYLEILPRPTSGDLRHKSVAAIVDSDRLEVMATYYVPREAVLRFTSGRVHYTIRGPSFFIPYCTAGSTVHVRLLEGSVRAQAPRSAYRTARVSTIEATAHPYPGRPDFRVFRHAGSTVKRTYATVTVPDHHAARMFVKASGVPGQGKIPCQAGGSVRIYADGRHRTG